MDNDELQRHLAWKKNARHLYEVLLAYELPWPSLTVQFFPEITYKDKKSQPGGAASVPGARARVQRLLLGTNTGGQATEYLRVGELTLPEAAAPRTLAEYDGELGTIGGFHSDLTGDFRVVQRIQARGVVARARYMPQNPNIVATAASTGEAAVWDLTKFPYRPVNTYLPTTKLVGHTAEALCADWSPASETDLATGDGTGAVLVWNMARGYDARTGEMAPATRRAAHAANTAVNDVQWHPRRAHVLASVGDDGWLHVHNTAAENAPLFMSVFLAPAGGADGGRPSAVAWNPVNDGLVVVGFDSGALELWDLSTTDPKRLHRWPRAHAGYVTRVAWNTHHPAVFASASEDKTAKVWDASLLGRADGADGRGADSATGVEHPGHAPDGNDPGTGPADGSDGGEPLFVHAGHLAPVTDLAWNPGEPGTVATVAEDNALHIWRAADNILGF